MKTDIHQHLWTEPLVQALAQRRELPFVRREHGLTVLYLAGERPYVIDLVYEAPARRAELVRGDGLDRALVCLSSPLGIESLPRAQALGAARRLPRGRARARRALRRVGRARARLPRPRRCRPRARARLRRPLAARGRARRRRSARASAPGARAPGEQRRAAVRAPGSRTGWSAGGRRERARRPALVAGAHVLRRRHARGFPRVPRRRTGRAPRAEGRLRDARRPRAAALRAPGGARRPVTPGARPARLLRHLLLRPARDRRRRRGDRRPGPAPLRVRPPRRRARAAPPSGSARLGAARRRQRARLRRAAAGWCGSGSEACPRESGARIREPEASARRGRRRETPKRPGRAGGGSR